MSDSQMPSADPIDSMTGLVPAPPSSLAQSANKAKKTDYSLTTQPVVPDSYAQLPPKKRAAIDRRMTIVKTVIATVKSGSV